jgi:hypothetical protein
VLLSVYERVERIRMSFVVMLRNLSLGLTITVLLPLAVYWGRAVVDFKPVLDVDVQMPKSVNIEQMNLAERADYDAQMKSYNLAYDAARKVYEQKRDLYDRNSFFIYGIIGCMVIIVGSFLSNMFLGIGFIFSGIILLIMGTLSYWNQMEALIKFLLLFVALVLIIIVSYKIERNSTIERNNAGGGA